jgi:hypothetical protein
LENFSGTAQAEKPQDNKLAVQEQQKDIHWHREES